MNLISIGLLAAFVILWLGIAWTGGVFSEQPRGKRFAAACLVASAAVVALGFWWRVPLEAQHTVDRAISGAASTTPRNFTCAELEQARPGLERMGKDLIALSDEGELSVQRAVWTNLSAEQKAALLDFAARARACSGAQNDEVPVQVRDIETGEVLS